MVKKAACGDLFTLFLSTSGEVFGCGSSTYVGNPMPGKSRTLSNQTVAPHLAVRLEPLVGSYISDIVAGSAHALALTASGEVYTWGSNVHCELGYESSSVNSGDSLFSGEFISVPTVVIIVVMCTSNSPYL